ncbi:MAG: hypothetical protein JRF15_16260, partial [Deltaproteobacteria bacterium]|nr:hypothetical protein [Deltaproteobacteria bacterium]
MLALVVAFGAAFVLLSLVTARLDALDTVDAGAATDQAWTGPAQGAEPSTTPGTSSPSRQTAGNAARRSLFLFYLGLTAATVLLLTYVLLTYFIVRPIDRLRLAS